MSKAGRLERVALFFGEPVLTDEAVGAWFTNVAERAWSPTALDIIRPPDEPLTSAIANMSQSGLFNSNCGVWIKGIRNEPQEDIEEFLEFLTNRLPPDALVVATCRSLDKRGKLFKWFNKQAIFKDLRLATEKSGRIQRDEVISLVRRRAERFGVRIPAGPVMERIYARAGTDAGQLIQEIDKLCMGADRGVITTDQVNDAMIDHAGAWVFDLTDAMGARDAARAQRIVDRLIDQGEVPLAIIATLSKRVVGLVEACRTLPHFSSPPDFGSVDGFLSRSMNSLPGRVRARFAPGYHTYVLFRDASRFAESELRQLHRMLLRLDVGLKTSNLSPRLGLCEFVQKACATPTRPSLP